MAEKWEKFCRTNWPEAYCVINDNGEWVDSGDSFETALLWVSYQLEIGHNTQEILDSMEKSGYSIISLKMCRKMYEAGLIK